MFRYFFPVRLKVFRWLPLMPHNLSNDLRWPQITPQGLLLIRREPLLLISTGSQRAWLDRDNNGVEIVVRKHQSLYCISR